MKRIQTSLRSLRVFALGLSLAAVLGAGALAAPSHSLTSRHGSALRPVQIARGGGDGQESHGGGGKGGGHRHSLLA
ncbi:MAG TPA: hypothetical protein VKT32_14650 [Chthonomonadaceae bacterium]|nr:hypothetical protein [Chthonomonadaceae bacterium]